jgi:hypothetical protein
MNIIRWFYLIATPYLAFFPSPIASISSSNGIDSSCLLVERLSISHSYIGNTSDYSIWVGLLMLLLLFCLGSSIMVCTSTITLLSLNWDIFLIVTSLYRFSTQWSKWYFLMMVKIGPIKVFLGLLAFLYTTKISLCSFCANHIAQFTSSSVTTWIIATSALGAYLFLCFRMRIYVKASSFTTFSGPLDLQIKWPKRWM